MSEKSYDQLRKITKENKRKGAFPFPTYAQALFSQVFISRNPVQAGLTSRNPEKPYAIPGKAPQTQIAQTNSSEVTSTSSEKSKVFSALDKFVSDKTSDSGSKEVNFPGGKIVKKDDQQGMVIDLSEIKDTKPAYWVDESNVENLKVIFVGEQPKDFSEEAKNSDLLSKMISAMKLADGSFSRIFLEKDKEEAKGQWNSCLQKVSTLNEVVVVSLGAMATNVILGRKERLSRIHGQEFTLIAQSDQKESTLSVYPVFHPDILQINPNMKRSAWMDLQKVMQKLGQS